MPDHNFNQKITLLWSIADEVLRDDFKRGKYQDVILPLTVMRRLDAALTPTKQAVLDEDKKLDALGIKDRDGRLRRVSGFAFYNTSPFDFEKLVGDADGLRANLLDYINGFSPNVRDLLEKFDFYKTLDKLDEKNLLFMVMEKFANTDLHPSSVSNHEMGYIFEDLIRRFNEALDENPGEHFTPREVIALMVTLLVLADEDFLAEGHLIRTVYDPCCGTGGMLNIAKQRLMKINPAMEVFLFGQEVNDETYAIAKADFLMASEDGADADRIKSGSTLSDDQLSDQTFHYLLANPPYGKDWKKDKTAVEAEAAKGDAGRFGAGLPRISDGQLLFLQHMISRMRPASEGGGRIAIVMNGSPLFSGDAGSGESQIRRWILENDLLEAIIGLPEELFYNTNIKTYIWILSNRKPEARKKKVQIIDASGREFWKQMGKSLGQKRRELLPGHIEAIARLYFDFDQADSPHSQIWSYEHFGFRKITVERPLRRSFAVTDEGLDRLEEEKPVAALSDEERHALRRALQAIDANFMDQESFVAAVDAAVKAEELKLKAPVKKAILNSLSERDDAAEISRDTKGRPLPDPGLRFTERVPLGGDIDSFVDDNVLPFAPDAFLNLSFRDAHDGDLGKVGYEINFNRHFFEPRSPRSPAEIRADILDLETEMAELVESALTAAED